jgi:excisionase family DNA binding protein
MGNNNYEKWITLDEAADFLSVKPVTVRDWIKKGKSIPARKIGRKWAFKCSELDSWVKSGDSTINKG